jgi:hypothetical protein
VRILFISNNRFQEDTIRNSLQDVAEGDSIKFVYSFYEAENFIQNHVVEKQTRLDIIITQEFVAGENDFDFQNEIKLENMRTYSNRDFKLSSIPILVISDGNSPYHGTYRFTGSIRNFNVERLHRYIPEIISEVKSWRRGVLDELDNLGIRHNSGRVDSTYYIAGRVHKTVETDILSEMFKQFPRTLNYEWLLLNERQIEIAVDKFAKEVRRSIRLQKKGDELRFHELFKKYEFLLKRDNYIEQWHEPRLRYNEGRYWEPDFVLEPNFNQRTDLSLLEIKLPYERFIKKGDFHPNFYQKIMDHIAQVNDYKRYLESDEYQEIIRQKFGFYPTTVEYNILVGTSEAKFEKIELYNQRKGEFAPHINFITYDDLAKYQVKFLERMNMLKVS